MLPTDRKKPLDKQFSSGNTPGTTEKLIQIDKDLVIKVPVDSSSSREEAFLFEPYTQNFINETVKFLHVVVTEIEPDLLSLQFISNRFLKNLRLLNLLTHYIHLLEQHKIYQLRQNSLQPLQRLKEKLLGDLILAIQKNPDTKVNQVYEFFLSLNFEDVYAGTDFYKKILLHLQKKHVKTADFSWDWMEKQIENESNTDAIFTYKKYLDKSPVKITLDLKKYLQILYHENILATLPVRSQTYLKRAKNMIRRLELLEPMESVLRNLQLEAEFSALQFESYEAQSGLYDQLMQLYPKIPESENWFANTPERTALFFPFFDQLMQYTDKKFQSGFYSCIESVPVNRSACIDHWKEAAYFALYIAKWAPYQILSEEAVDRLKVLLEKNPTDYNFVSRIEVLQLMDQIPQKPVR